MSGNGVEVLIQLRGRHWCFIIEETTIANLHRDVWGDSIIWTNLQLENNPNVKRMAYHMWYFKTKKEAEVFKTLFMLRWAE